MRAVVVAAARIAAILLTWPFQARIDPPPDERVQHRLVSFRLTDILVPMRSLSRGERLWRASWVGCLLAIPQAAWITFMVTYLVVALGQSLEHRRSGVRRDADQQHVRPRHPRLDRRPRRLRLRRR